MTLPVVCLHGWGMRGAIFRGIAQPGWITPDLPGYGTSTLPDNATAASLADVLSAQAPDKIILLGWSMGSLIAQAWAARHPQQVEALILVAATPCFQQREKWAHGLPAADVAAFAQGVASDWRATLNRFLSLQARGSEDARSLIAQLRAEISGAGEPRPETLAAGMRLLAETDLRDAVSTLKQPTLLIHGERDGICPLPAAQWLAAQMPNAQLTLIARAAHAPFLSHPQAFNTLVSGFIHAR
jgi:pimeloyl-[acyl-carrier protein] methyl ester esterase